MLQTRAIARSKCREVRKDHPDYRCRVGSLSYAAEF